MGVGGTQIWRDRGRRWDSSFHLGAWILCEQRPQNISERDLPIDPVGTGLVSNAPLRTKAEAKKSDRWWEREAHTNNGNFLGDILSVRSESGSS